MYFADGVGSDDIRSIVRTASSIWKLIGWIIETQAEWRHHKLILLFLLLKWGNNGNNDFIVLHIQKHLQYKWTEKILRNRIFVSRNYVVGTPTGKLKKEKFIKKEDTTTIASLSSIIAHSSAISLVDRRPEYVPRRSDLKWWHEAGHTHATSTRSLKMEKLDACKTSSGMCRRASPVRTDVSKELLSTIIKTEKSPS